MIGLTDLVPGVSGSTIAAALGVYDRLIEALSGFFSSRWRRHIGFLLPLAVGMASAMLLFSRVIRYLLEEHFAPTQFFFLGLVIGIVPMLAKRADARRSFRPRHLAALALCAALVASLAWLNPDRAMQPTVTLSALSAAGLFLSGWLASLAMLLPGISGSFVLLVLGVYDTAIFALSTLDAALIAVIGAGVVVGFITSSKAIRFLLARFPAMSHAAMIGLVAGSTFVIFPGLGGPKEMIAGAAALAAGFVLTLLLGERARP